jgi:acetylornithine deacetylase/succinyl-diaminopimelate desuccinylase-like protein
MTTEEALRELESHRQDCAADHGHGPHGRRAEALRIVLAMAKAADGMSVALDSLLDTKDGVAAAALPAETRGSIKCSAGEIADGLAALSAYREAINKKVEGKEITAEPAHEAGGKIIDLMEALKASLAKSGGKEAESETEDEKDAKPASKRSASARKRKSA